MLLLRWSSSPCSPLSRFKDAVAWRLNTGDSSAPRTSTFRDCLLFRTLVDGEPWAGAGSSCSIIPGGRSWRPLGQEIVYGTCPDPDVRPGVPLAFRGPGGPVRLLTPAKHTVQMEVHLPGTDVVLKSGTLMVDLTCPA